MSNCSGAPSSGEGSAPQRNTNALPSATSSHPSGGAAAPQIIITPFGRGSGRATGTVNPFLPAPGQSTAMPTRSGPSRPLPIIPPVEPRPLTILSLRSVLAVGDSPTGSPPPPLLTLSLSTPLTLAARALGEEPLAFLTGSAREPLAEEFPIRGKMWHWRPVSTPSWRSL